ncbi:S8 family serine peptidase [Paenibacillus lutrae]|uniref:S8 family serine peptidase n=1 Tax=Paenibacillus lutrae TaxID=2078573 RepID=A0A7X3K0J5_9BACL|nr:S8 family serine peptidase [Paenibacillus lutrae]MVP01314.1 S8 family serine peptidase [Paenibacillus lutrae]
MNNHRLIKQLSVVSLAFTFIAGTSLAQVQTAQAAQSNGFKLNTPGADTKALPDQAAGYISPKINTTSTESVRVIVQLKGQPAAVGKYAAKTGNSSLAAEANETSVNQEQTTLLNSARSSGIAMTVNYQYNTVLNGLEITVPANKIPELAKLPGVKSIHHSANYYPIPVGKPAGLDANSPTYDSNPLKQIGADAAWAKGLTGKGLKVGVIDTGVDYLHPDLKDAYKGGYDSFEKDNDPYEEPPLTPEEDPYRTGFEGTSHGTHVSGTIVGRAANKTSDIVQKGVAYEADLYVYKVLGRNTETGSASGSSAQVIDGIERAVKDGMNVINLSLGSDSEKDSNSPDVVAINNAVLGGVVTVIANGNAADKGPYYYSLGSPATSPLAISVGAVTSTTNQYKATVTEAASAAATAAASASASISAAQNQAATVTAAAYAPYDLNVMAWETGKENFAALLGTGAQDVVYVDLGQNEDYDGKDVAGKVVLISRGGIAFIDKITTAKSKGAKAAIIFNGNTERSNPNAADLSPSVIGRDGHIGSAAFLGDGFEYIPTFDMKGTEGRALARKALAAPGSALKLAFGPEYPYTETPGDTMATFSSRGPNVDADLGIKPDITAPGVSVLSTWPAYGKFKPGASYDRAYSRNSGTSMAAPHVAGLALLLKQQHPAWTPADIRAGLANTSDKIRDLNGTLYDVYSQGAGRANLANAIQTTALLETVEPITILDKYWNPQPVTNYGSSASFGVVAPGSNAQKELQFKNTSKQSQTYSAKVVLHSSVTSDPNAPTPTPDVNNLTTELLGLSSGGKITAAAGAEKSFFLSVTPKANAVKGVYEGEVVLEKTGQPTLHLPFAVHVGAEKPENGFGLQELELTETVIYPENDEDGPTTSDLSFRLTAKNINSLSLWLFGLDDKLIGRIDQIAQRNSAGEYKPIEPGVYSFEGIDGSYVDGEADENGELIVKTLGSGTYKLAVLAEKLDKYGNNPEQIAYTAYTSLRIANLESDKVAQAKDKFKTEIVNTKKLNQPVLKLPKTDGILYKVTNSNNKAYIDNKGILKLVPAKGIVNVELTVTISSVKNPEIKTTVKVPVVLSKSKVPDRKTTDELVPVE